MDVLRAGTVFLALSASACGFNSGEPVSELAETTQVGSEVDNAGEGPESAGETEELDRSNSDHTVMDEKLVTVLASIDTTIENALDLELFLKQSGLLSGFSSNDHAQLAQELENAREARIEELVVDCMRQEGFEYSTANPLYVTQFVIDENTDLGDRRWAETYGFGSSTWLELDNGRLPPGVVGMPLGSITQPIDNHPNALYFETLDNAGQSAYLASLEGDYSGGERSGCRYEAERATPPIGRYGGLIDYESGDALAERVKASVQFIDHERELVACVRDRGFPDYSGLGSGRSMAEDVLVESGILGPVVVDDADNPITSTQSSEDITTSVEQGSVEYFELLTEVQSYEVELAVAVFDCGGSTADQWELYTSIVAAMASAG